MPVRCKGKQSESHDTGRPPSAETREKSYDLTKSINQKCLLPPLPDLRLTQPTSQRFVLPPSHDRERRTFIPTRRIMTSRSCPKYQPEKADHEQNPCLPYRERHQARKSMRSDHTKNGKSLDWSLLPEPAAGKTGSHNPTARASAEKRPTCDTRSFDHWADITKNAFRESTSFYFPRRTPHETPGRDSKSTPRHLGDVIIGLIDPRDRPWWSVSPTPTPGPVVRPSRTPHGNPDFAPGRPAATRSTRTRPLSPAAGRRRTIETRSMDAESGRVGLHGPLHVRTRAPRGKVPPSWHC